MSRILPAERPRLIWRIAAIAAAAFAILAAFEDLDWMAAFGGLTTHGDYGVDSQPVGGSQTVGTVTGIVPGGPAARAGIFLGDVGTLLSITRSSMPAVGDRVRLMVDHAGQRREVTLVAVPSHRLAVIGADGRWPAVLNVLGDLPAVLLGLFILVRGRGQPATVLLGMALAAFGLNNPQTATPSFTWVTGAQIVTAIGQLSEYLMYACFPAFGLRLLNEAAGRRWRGQRAAFVAYLVVLAPAWAALVAFVDRAPVTIDLAPWLVGTGVVYLAGLGAGLGCLIAGWVISSPSEKPRYALLTLAAGCVFANQALNDVFNFLLNVRGAVANGAWEMQVANILAGVVAPVVFAYAVLRHRILDLGFALNRTLVYSTVSAILLGAFGLIEWAFDHFVKIQGREQNALIDAAIALGVYLCFHRVTGFVEHAVETLFFRRWQEKEGELRRFVADAAFISRRQNLLAGFSDALGRFADGAAAIYLKAETGGYARAAGGVAAPKSLGEDDPAVVRLRADRKPIEPAATGSALAAELACPMLHRGELMGVVLMAHRADGLAFRPDETELLGWATLQVGLDLHALEVERLQAAVTRLEHQLEGARLASQPN